MNSQPVYEYVDSQVQNPTVFYDGTLASDTTNVYGNFQLHQPEIHTGGPTGSMKKKKYSKKKRNTSKHLEDKMKEGAALAAGQIGGRLQDSHAKDANFTGEVMSQLQDLHFEDVKFEKSVAEATAAGVDVETKI